MRRHLSSVSLLSVAATVLAQEPSCAASSSSALSFAHGEASLTIATGAPPPSDLAVPIRGRSRLVYSWHSALPEHIRSPTTDAFPLVARADDASANLTDYAAAAAALLAERLIPHGAVLFRGLPLADGAAYGEFVEALQAHDGWTAVKLGGGGTQRKDVSLNVRTASEEPDEHTIEPHGDMAHSVAHPKRIGFFCAAGPPPGAGGETVLTDMRAVHATLEAQGVPQAFEAHGGVAYVKRLWSAEHVNHSYTWQVCASTLCDDHPLPHSPSLSHPLPTAPTLSRLHPLPPPLTLPRPARWLLLCPWQTFFFTTELEEAVGEVRKRDPHAAVDAAAGTIDYREVLPVRHAHPKTGEPLWFNGVHTNHRSYYEEALHVDTSDGPPMHTTFADGEPIPDETIAAVRAAVWKASVAVRLQAGDLVVVDNMLASHGRMGWVPGNPRKVLLTHFK